MFVYIIGFGKKVFIVCEYKEFDVQVIVGRFEQDGMVINGGSVRYFNYYIDIVVIQFN